jgi:predicted Zn finger-like uncharacterized protein
MTDGTARCPHCNTRFRIAEAQLEAHHGMVRCGLCLQAFDAHPNFIPDQPAPQLELLIPDAQVEQTEQQLTGQLNALEDALPAEETGTAHFLNNETPGFNQSLTLAEQVAIMPDGYRSTVHPKRRSWPWTIAALLLLLILLAQAAYFFRVELAARLPGMKPALTGYCRLLQCSVPLPQKTDLMSIESSGLEADPANENQITLNALLRNRAGYAQAFPCLELTLNDNQDKPLARRSFRPSEYLPPSENETTGLPSNRELSIKLHLNMTDIKPMGYRLVLFYPAG